MSPSDGFDPGDAWAAVSAAWLRAHHVQAKHAKTLHGYKTARDTCLALVRTQAALDQILAYIAADSEGGRRPTGDAGRLSAYLERHLGAPPPVVVAAADPAAAAAGPGVVAEVQNAFERVWAAWPKNERPEKRRAAEAAFHGRAADAGLAVVEAATARYIDCFADPASGMVHPYHLASFLNDTGRFEEWATRAETKLASAEDKAAFEYCWARYPDYPRKAQERDDAFVFWLRHVQPEARLPFACSVLAYRDAQRGRAAAGDTELKGWTRGFLKHVGSWWAQSPEPYARRVGPAIGRALYALNVFRGATLPAFVLGHCRADQDWRILHDRLFFVLATVKSGAEAAAAYRQQAEGLVRLLVYAETDEAAGRDGPVLGPKWRLDPWVLAHWVEPGRTPPENNTRVAAFVAAVLAEVEVRAGQRAQNVLSSTTGATGPGDACQTPSAGGVER